MKIINVVQDNSAACFFITGMHWDNYGLILSSSLPCYFSDGKQNSLASGSDNQMGSNIDIQSVTSFLDQFTSKGS